MGQEDVAARREFHARRSRQEKQAAGMASSPEAARRHLVLHRLHEVKSVDCCCVRRAGHFDLSPPPAVKSAPHLVILETPEQFVIELSPQQALSVAERIIEKAAEACGDGMLVDEMAMRKRAPPRRSANPSAMS